jgi:retron-type reverse transcriptase
VSEYATAYKPGASVLKNGEPHAGKDLILKLDIKNFFSSIGYDMLLSRVFCDHPEPVKHLLLHLCCRPRDGRENGVPCLPQGAPTSPYIANIYMRAFDDCIGEYCRRAGVSYTRYADDMTFSGSFDPDGLIEKVKEKLGSRLRLNGAKTRTIRKGRRQIVTGLVVNEKPRVPSEYRRTIRQEMYYCGKYGVESHVMYMRQKQYLGESRYTKSVWAGKQAYLESLEGRINYVLGVDPLDAQMLRYREEVRSWSDGIRSGEDPCPR